MAAEFWPNGHLRVLREYGDSAFFCVTLFYENGRPQERDIRRFQAPKGALPLLSERWHDSGALAERILRDAAGKAMMTETWSETGELVLRSVDVPGRKRPEAHASIKDRYPPGVLEERVTEARDGKDVLTETWHVSGCLVARDEVCYQDRLYQEWDLTGKLTVSRMWIYDPEVDRFESRRVTKTGWYVRDTLKGRVREWHEEASVETEDPDPPAPVVLAIPPPPPRPRAVGLRELIYRHVDGFARIVLDPTGKQVSYFLSINKRPVVFSGGKARPGVYVCKGYDGPVTWIFTGSELVYREGSTWDLRSPALLARAVA